MVSRIVLWALLCEEVRFGGFACLQIGLLLWGPASSRWALQASAELKLARQWLLRRLRLPLYGFSNRWDIAFRIIVTSAKAAKPVQILILFLICASFCVRNLLWM